MKRAVICAAVLLIALSVSAHNAHAQKPKADTPPVPAEGIKMPADYSAKLADLQEQSGKLDKDYEQVIAIYKEYVARRADIQAQASVLITRAALAAKLTIEQFDTSDLKPDGAGGFVWIPKSKPEGAKVTQPSKPNGPN